MHSTIASRYNRQDSGMLKLPFGHRAFRTSPPDLNIHTNHTKKRGEGAMCTVGGGPDIGNIESLAAKDYECLDCKNKFKAMGRKAMCPSCKSRNVKSV
jgi:hypothetical protein